MGTKVYGASNSIASVYGGLTFKPYVDYAVKTNNDTAYVLTLAAGIKLTDVWGDRSTSVSITLTATGKSNAIGSRSFDTAYAYKDYTIIASRDISWTKAHASQTITVTAYNNSSKKASKTFTIPAKTSYTISYNNNADTVPGATITNIPGKQTKWHGEPLNLQSTKPKGVDSTTGYEYVFKGWNTAANGTGTMYQPGQAYTGNPSGGLTLYAIWEKRYYAPTIQNLNFERCLQNGELDDEGAYGKVAFDWSISQWKHSTNAVDGNITVTLSGVDKDGVPISYTTSITPTSGATSGTITLNDNIVLGNNDFDTDHQYTGTVVLSDTSGETDATTTVTGYLEQSSYPIDISANGRSIGIFKPASDDDDYLFDVGGVIRIGPGIGGRWPSSENGLILTSDVDPSIHPSVNKWANGMAVKDADDERFAYVEGAHTTEGYIGISLVGRRVISGSISYNYVRLLIDDNGNDIVQLDAPTAWMSALSPGVTTYGYAKFYCNSGFEPYSTSGVDAPTAIKFGRVVTLMGAYRKVGAQSSAADITIGKVPEGCQPFRQVRFVEQGSGQNRFLLQINPDRTMTVRRYGVASNIAIGADGWLNICCTYISES